MTRQVRIACMVAAVAWLAACGGGGGDTPVAGTAGSGGGGASGDPTVPAGESPRIFSISGNLVTSVPAPTYTAGSEELAAFNFLNQERSNCGVGRVTQAATLDTAAQGHADWAIVNNYIGHVQVSGTPGFTGVTSSDRVAAAGYSALGTFQVADEIRQLIGTSSKVGEGVRGTRALLSAPYHALGMLGEYRDLGVSIRNNTDVASVHGARVVVQYDLAYKDTDGAHQIPLGGLATYPCNGVTGVHYGMNGETPNPVPGRDLAANPIGHPSYFIANPGVNLTVNSISINKTGSPAVALLPTKTNANDAAGIVKPHQAFVMPDLPLDPSSTYNVTYSVTLRVYGYGQVLCNQADILAQGFTWNGTGCSKTINGSYSYTTGTNI